MRWGYLVASLGAAVLLFWAPAKHPYDYYTLLRWAVCAVACYGVLNMLRKDMTAWAIATGFVALIFNPIFPVHLRRSTWATLDILAGIYLLVTAFVLMARKGKPQGV